VSGERTPGVINVEDSRKRVVVIDVVVSWVGRDAGVV
jgi:hypothetical protein